MTHDHSLIPARRKRHWKGRGLTDRQEKILNVSLAVLVLVMVGGWILSVYQVMNRIDSAGAPPALPASRVSEGAFSNEASSVAFLTQLAMEATVPLRGLSGELKAGMYNPGTELTDLESIDPSVELSFEDQRGREIAAGVYSAPELPGIYRIALGIERYKQAIPDFSVITRVPFSEKKSGRIGSYRLGDWPYEDGGTPKSPAYRNPAGFIEITPENIDTPVSTHFVLGDFLTKGQEDVWPKYLLLEPQLVDKLELTIQELEKRGVEVENVKVMSGFRHPYYNYGGGNTQGRANLSRHMYGDAADIFVDNDENNWSDDVTGDGKLTLADAEFISDAADAVEKEHPTLTGGIGIYPACCGHGPMVHIDVRGYRARWVY